MKRTVSILLTLCLLMVASCSKRWDDYKPEIQLSIDKKIEATTHIFTLRVETDEPVPSYEKLYCRFDWDGDKIWDSPFSQDLEVSHRFYIPGTYDINTEVLTKNGLQDSATITVTVEQGFSSPRPVFTMSPASGNFNTVFRFDASETRDDEDSLSSLKFRWSFTIDEDLVTPFHETPIYEHKFGSSGHFKVKLEAIDPSLRKGTYVEWVDIHNRDSSIIPSLVITPIEGSVMDTFIFDARGSYHEIDPERELLFHWKMPVGNVATYPGHDSVTSHIFEEPGHYTIGLTLFDANGLQNSIEKEFFVALGNRPPEAAFQTATPYGNIRTQFYFSSANSRDDKTAGSELLKEWDFDGDGNWDTEKILNQEIYYQYPSPGKYQVRLKVTDPEGASDTCSMTAFVSQYDNPTDFILDKRDYKLYGTVKIGNTWWMSENLDYRDNDKMGIPMIQKCYNEDPKLCDKYGSLYQIERVYHYIESGKHVCPDGWRLPGKAEMEELSDNLPASESRDAVLPGGSMTFNGQYSGHGDYYFVYWQERIIDTVYTYRNINKEGFVSSADYIGGQYRVRNLFFSKDSPEAWVFSYPAGYFYYPLRCVKE